MAADDALIQAMSESCGRGYAATNLLNNRGTTFQSCAVICVISLNESDLKLKIFPSGNVLMVVNV